MQDPDSLLLSRSRVQFPAGGLGVCIFRNWSRLGPKMYIFLTLEFTLAYFKKQSTCCQRV